jgi:Fe-S-cluster containining protein
MDIDFGCTACGKCCHNLRLPLTVGEAIAWLKRGHRVQLFVEAVPWLEEPPSDDRVAAHKRRRSFPAFTGSLPVRVVPLIVAAYDGPCPSLQADMRCSIYEERPLVCRIYPAEINPFISLDPSNKECPPEAWTPVLKPLMRGGKIVDAETVALIEQSRTADARDVGVKAAFCRELWADSAAVSNEGFAIYSPEPSAALQALERAKSDVNPGDASRWRFVSNRRATVDALRSVGAVASPAPVSRDNDLEYLAFHPGDIG